MTSEPRAVITAAEVERALQRIFIAAEGTSLRREDRKKAIEVAAFLNELARVGTRGAFVDAAAGKAYLGLLAAELLGVRDLRVIERAPDRALACRAAATRIAAAAHVDVRCGDVADASHWPDAPRAVIALHACGRASDAILDASVRARARWLFLVPCCYAADVPFAAQATRLADRLGVARQAEVRRRFILSLVDTERTLRLEAAGYEVTVVPFVPPTVTGHHLLFRARLAQEPVRMREAAARWAELTSSGSNVQKT